jgi:hypothetical protein
MIWHKKTEKDLEQERRGIELWKQISGYNNIDFAYYFYKLCTILFLAAILVSYLKNLDTLLSILSCGAMNSIAIEIIFKSNKKKIDLDIKELMEDEGSYKKIDIIPFYIIGFLFWLLALLQIINFISFSNTNNLILSVLMAIYMLYKIEKYHKVKRELYDEMKEKFKDMFK